MTKSITDWEHRKAVLATESNDFVGIQSRITRDKIRMLHAAMGIATESGELLDALKKHLFYGGPLDTVNLIEEAGDLLYYIEILLDVLNLSASEVRAKNKAKLETRYGGKFSSDRALNRDLEAENKALEE